MKVRAALGMIVFSILAAAQTDSAAKVVEVPSFTVIGISCRTTNAREAGAEGCIGKQWGRLFGEGMLEKIPDRADHNIIAVYTDYAGDKNGEYSHVLGAKVADDATPPAGMVKVVVPAGKYAVFTSTRGPIAQVVQETWRRIWNTPKSEPGGDRAYRADFELHDQRTSDPKNAVVDVYVGVR